MCLEERIKELEEKIMRLESMPDVNELNKRVTDLEKYNWGSKRDKSNVERKHVSS